MNVEALTLDVISFYNICAVTQLEMGLTIEGLFIFDYCAPEYTLFYKKPFKKPVPFAEKVS